MSSAEFLVMISWKYPVLHISDLFLTLFLTFTPLSAIHSWQTDDSFLIYPRK